MEQQRKAYEHLIDHQNDNVVTAVTNMIDQVRNDLELGIRYLIHTPEWHQDHDEAGLA